MGLQDAGAAAFCHAVKLHQGARSTLEYIGFDLPGKKGPFNNVSNRIHSPLPPARIVVAERSR